MTVPEVTITKPSCFGDYEGCDRVCMTCDYSEECKCESKTECWLCPDNEECGESYDE